MHKITLLDEDVRINIIFDYIILKDYIIVRGYD